MGSTTNDLVLLTGGTGHLGFRVLLSALEAGYSVRAAVRSEKKAETIMNNAVLKALNRGSQLSFVVVADFLVEGAFDEAVKGVKYIIHVASPIPTGMPADGDYDKMYLKPAVQGTLGVFESAKKAGSVARIVVTSSVVAIMPPSALHGVPLGDFVIDADSRISDLPGPFDDPFSAYVASKVAALNAGERWVKEQKPEFDVVTIHPSFIIGRDDLLDSTASFQDGTNKYALNTVIGVDVGVPAAPTQHNYVNDTAKAHVVALDPKVAGNQAFILSSDATDGMQWNDSQKIAEKHFPDAFQKGVFTKSVSLGSFDVPLDNSKTEKILGIKISSYETAAKSVLGHYLELLEEEKKKGK